MMAAAFSNSDSNSNSKESERAVDGASETGKHTGGFFSKIHEAAHGLKTRIAGHFADHVHSHTHAGASCASESHDLGNRFDSFAAPRNGNEVKWYVDGCGYMWAVSIALERAKESIWIMDWWLSPELYLRRPPSKNEGYRLDRMLAAAAQRGVKINIMVYKEVEQALTLSSAYTKHALEALHPNIAVFRHPDHVPDAENVGSALLSDIQNLSLSAASLAQLPSDAHKVIYGVSGDVVLFWAHHEKMCIVDGEMAFMGGLDLCYGRWDTNQHPIADAHPENLNDIIFPGQDYNNARIMDFANVNHWEQNKLDRKESSRIGWSDVSICLAGPAVDDLKLHFTQRWNFIYAEKYAGRANPRYGKIRGADGLAGLIHGHMVKEGQPPAKSDGPSAIGDGKLEPSGEHVNQAHGQSVKDEASGTTDHLKQKVKSHVHHAEDKYLGSMRLNPVRGPLPCQIVRSCSEWSHGVRTEHSIANAYISVIRDSRHFVYIENQFFITTTTDAQRPARNKIGAALVERIVRAAERGERYMVIVIMPAIPGFAGDLKDDGSLGTRAIMGYQYESINRGGDSIMETLLRKGINPTEHIRFYNLRNYDRINVSATMQQAEKQSGVDYELARREHDDQMDPMGYRAQSGATLSGESAAGDHSRQFQAAATNIADQKNQSTGRWDTVSECYMLNGTDIRNVPWVDGDVPEIDAFVSEELYVHTKLLIADDRVVICGSANLNDRSQLGSHDSEIAIIVEDPQPIESLMDGAPWQATKFAASLRRQLFRKHLGLLPAQDFTRPTANFDPIGSPNEYQFGSPEDLAVADPLSDAFLSLWNGRAKQNTLAFGRIFHPVPHDNVRSWQDYDKFYEGFFHGAGDEADGKATTEKPPKYRWGHVVTENFSPGQQGLSEVKDLLSTIKGTLVEMPLLFLINENLVKTNLSLNAFTEEVYT